jgi:hypothetical protein
MNISKYRIRKLGGQWCVLSPGWTFSPVFRGNSFRHCVNALPYLRRIADNHRRLSRG